ncbi:VOC family protein [Actinomadura keratinilytica]
MERRRRGPVRTAHLEVCLNLDGAPASVDARYEEWKAKGVTIVEEPQDAVFGRTFVAADPDGNLIRVAPFD